MINTSDEEIFTHYGVTAFERDQLRKQLAKLQHAYNQLEAQYKALLEVQHGDSAVHTES